MKLKAKKRLFDTTLLVKSVLLEYPQTRDNDYLLWLKVLQKTQCGDIPDFLNIPVSVFLRTARYMKIPQYESVSRARRRLQAKYRELRATQETQEARAEQEIVYKEYSQSNV